MRNLFISILVCVMWGLHACQPATGLIVPSPIYVDNHYHGPADPEITWNPKTKEWMIFIRRADHLKIRLPMWAPL